ncbi:MAG: hypothetical protein J5809_01745 [Selenomonadaceae bacterium]|nr:hypothetical protein [Selenomonadaceae bacterium]
MIEVEYRRSGVVEGPQIIETPKEGYSRSKISRTLKFTSDNLDNPEILFEDHYTGCTSQRMFRASATNSKRPLSKTEGVPIVEVVRSDPVIVQEKAETFVLSHLGIGLVAHEEHKADSVAFYDTLEQITYPPSKYPSYYALRADKFTFPLQDGYYLEVGGYALGAGEKYTVYDGENSQICYDDSGVSYNVMRSISNGNNFMITPLGHGKPQSYLLGQRNGTLYRVTNNQFEKIGTGLKNCRLREMKNISKAKR